MLNRSLNAGTQVRCQKAGSNHEKHFTSTTGFTDGKVYVLSRDFEATGSAYDSVRVAEDDNGSNHNGWNAACFVEVDAAPAPAWDADAVKQLLDSLLQKAVDAKEWTSSRAIIEKLVLF
jgi:hypothetical protein